MSPLQVFLALWREVALEVGDMKDEDRETFWKTLTDSIERAMSTAGQSILVGFDDEDDEDELDSPWIDIIDRQPERRRNNASHDNASFTLRGTGCG